MADLQDETTTRSSQRLGRARSAILPMLDLIPSQVQAWYIFAKELGELRGSRIVQARPDGSASPFGNF